MVDSGLNVNVNEEQPCLLTMSYHIYTVHIVTGLNENADLDEWMTFDDHGRKFKKWAPLDGPSAGCSMLLLSRTDLLHGLHDLGTPFKSQESKEVIVRIMDACGYDKPGMPREVAVTIRPKRKHGNKDLSRAVKWIKADLVKLMNKIDKL